MYTCPKCHNQMQTYTRTGLTIEQCDSCRGVFLDYGELERLVQAEGQYYQQQYAQPAPPPPAPGMRPPGSFLPGSHSHGAHHGHHHRYGHRKSKSFLGELFLD